MATMDISAAITRPNVPGNPREDNDWEPGCDGILKAVHATDDNGALFIVTCAEFIHPSVTADSSARSCSDCQGALTRLQS